MQIFKYRYHDICTNIFQLLGRAINLCTIFSVSPIYVFIQGCIVLYGLYTQDKTNKNQIPFFDNSSFFIIGLIRLIDI